MTSTPNSPTTARSWLRFGLRTMFVVVPIALVAFGLGWLGGRAQLRIEQAHENRAVEEAVFDDPFEEEVTDSMRAVNSAKQVEVPVRSERARLQFEKTRDKGDWGSPLHEGSGFF